MSPRHATQEIHLEVHDFSRAIRSGVSERGLPFGRRNPLDWRTNVSRGAKTERLELTPELIDLAHRAADSVGAPLAGVDVLPDKDGRLYLLEVNAVPGWKALARTLEVDLAAKVLQFVSARCKAR